MKKQILASVMVLSLVACAGREAVQVDAYKARDNELNCAAIDQEIGRNNAAIRARTIEDKDRDGRNMIIGAVGIILFWPALFALDLKDAPGKEIAMINTRNQTLTRYAQDRGCTVQAAVDPAAVHAEVQARYDAMDDGVPAGHSGDIAARGSMPTSAPETVPSMGAAPLASATPTGDRATLHFLMDAFLNGEISKAEYDSRRAALGI